MRRIRKPNEELPPFYGIAWYDRIKEELHCYPIPINLLIIGWQWVEWGWDHYLTKGNLLPDRDEELYWKGYHDGQADLLADQATKSKSRVTNLVEWKEPAPAFPNVAAE